MSTFYARIPRMPTVETPGRLGKTYQQDQWRAEFDQETQLLAMSNVPVDAVFIGDSLTASWPIHNLLRDIFPRAINRGVGGDCAAHLGARLAADVLQLRPRYVILMIGTNDVSYRFGYESDDTIVQNYIGNMSSILERLATLDAECFIGTIPPVRQVLIRDEEYARKRSCIPRMNAGLKKLVTQFRMKLVDYYPHFFDAQGRLHEDLYIDGPHFNARGQYLMTLVLRSALTQLKQPEKMMRRT